MKSSVNELLAKLAGAQSGNPPETAETEVELTDPTFVEKLASAVDYSLDHLDDAFPEYSGTTEEPQTTSVVSALIERMKEKQASVGDSRQRNIIQAVLQKVASATAEQLPEPQQEPPPAEDELDSETAVGEDTDSSSGDLEGLSLSEVLQDALGIGDGDESPAPRAETDEVRTDDEAGNRMRGLLVKRLRLVTGKGE